MWVDQYDFVETNISGLIYLLVNFRGKIDPQITKFFTNYPRIHQRHQKYDFAETNISGRTGPTMPSYRINNADQCGKFCGAGSYRTNGPCGRNNGSCGHNNGPRDWIKTNSYPAHSLHVFTIRYINRNIYESPSATNPCLVD